MTATAVETTETHRPDRSDGIAELAKALSAAQREVETASKDSVNPHFNRSYADLASVWQACREPLTKNGLSVMQRPVSEGNRVGVITTVLHSSGQWMESTLWTVPQQAGPQAMGSCITYLRRYSLSAVAGVAPDDDDGNAASPKGKGREPVDPQYRRTVGESAGPKASTGATSPVKYAASSTPMSATPASATTGTVASGMSSPNQAREGAAGEKPLTATPVVSGAIAAGSKNQATPPPPNGTKGYLMAREVPVFAKDPLADKAQLAQIHILRAQCNWADGEVDETQPVKSWPLYRQALGAYKTHDGKRCLHSNELTHDQAANLIRRMEASKGRKEDAHASMEASGNLEAVVPPITPVDFAETLHGVFPTASEESEFFSRTPWTDADAVPEGSRHMAKSLALAWVGGPSMFVEAYKKAAALGHLGV